MICDRCGKRQKFCLCSTSKATTVADLRCRLGLHDFRPIRWWSGWEWWVERVTTCRRGCGKTRGNDGG